MCGSKQAAQCSVLRFLVCTLGITLELLSWGCCEKSTRQSKGSSQRTKHTEHWITSVLDVVAAIDSSAEVNLVMTTLLMMTASKVMSSRHLTQSSEEAPELGRCLAPGVLHFLSKIDRVGGTRGTDGA